jgi:hypothetical protein
VVGRGGDNVKFIQQETGCKVQIKGQGSGFMESSTGVESEDPMYLHIAGPRPEGVEHAKTLCEELLQKVRADYQEFKENAPQGRFGGGGDRYTNGRSGGYDGRSGGGYGDRSAGYEGRPGGYGDRERSQSYGQGGYGGHGGQSDYQSPVTAADPAAQGADYSQWAAYYAQTGQQPGTDPYAQYGGYEGYVQWYNYYAAQQAGTTQSPAPGTAAAPPPPPSEPGPPGGAPPPPPPSGSPPGTYNAVSKHVSLGLPRANDGQGSSTSGHVSTLIRDADPFLSELLFQVCQ